MTDPRVHVQESGTECAHAWVIGNDACVFCGVSWQVEQCGDVLPLKGRTIYEHAANWEQVR